MDELKKIPSEDFTGGRTGGLKYTLFTAIMQGLHPSTQTATGTPQVLFG